MSYDAIIIPGGGLDQAGNPAPWVLPRLDAAFQQADDAILIPLSSGTTHKAPILDSAGFPIHECVASARYLIAKGISPARILLDTWSLDTIGNAYFARVMHCEPRQLTRLLVITSDFHMPRTQAIFNWIFSVAPLPIPFEIHFHSVADTGMDATTLAARLEKEQASLDSVHSLAQRHTTLASVNQFLFTEHGAYHAGSRPAVKPADRWANSY
ncbi:MAG: YdcF family protein [Acidobacteria bacterium]|nr:YdcF family protein [Acidobacteriota bacterium]